MAWLNSKKLFIWLPFSSSSSSSVGFVKSEETICCPVIMVGQGGWGLQIGKGNKIERKWQLLSQNLQYLAPCLQQACHLNKNLFLISPGDSGLVLACVCVCTCTPVCPVDVLAYALHYLTLIIFKSGLFLSQADMLSVWCRLLKPLFFPFSPLHDALDHLQMDRFSMEWIVSPHLTHPSPPYCFHKICGSINARFGDSKCALMKSCLNIDKSKAHLEWNMQGAEEAEEWKHLLKQIAG